MMLSLSSSRSSITAHTTTGNVSLRKSMAWKQLIWLQEVGRLLSWQNQRSWWQSTFRMKKRRQYAWSNSLSKSLWNVSHAIAKEWEGTVARSRFFRAHSALYFCRSHKREYHVLFSGVKKKGWETENGIRFVAILTFSRKLPSETEICYQGGQTIYLFVNTN